MQMTTMVTMNLINDTEAKKLIHFISLLRLKEELNNQSIKKQYLHRSGTLNVINFVQSPLSPVDTAIILN